MIDCHSRSGQNCPLKRIWVVVGEDAEGAGLVPLKSRSCGATNSQIIVCARRTGSRIASRVLGGALSYQYTSLPSKRMRHRDEPSDLWLPNSAIDLRLAQLLHGALAADGRIIHFLESVGARLRGHDRKDLDVPVVVLVDGLPVAKIL